VGGVGRVGGDREGAAPGQWFVGRRELGCRETPMMGQADGIRRALRFCPKGSKAPPLAQAVRLVPKTAAAPAHVYAISGAVGIRVDVEGDVPDVVLAAGTVRSALKGASELEGVEEVGTGTVILHVRSRAGVVDYKVPGGVVSTFPLFPPVPTEDLFQALPGFRYAVQAVAPAAGKDAKRPELGVLHFEHGYVEATDLARLCRLETRWNLTGHVPAEVVAGWPADVEVVSGVVSDPYLFLRVGSELRCAALREPGRYHAKMATYLGEDMPGVVALAARDMIDAAKRSLDVSPWGVVVLDLTGERCVARSYMPDRKKVDEASCEVTVRSPRPAVGGTTAQVIVSARYLADALAAACTPLVVLRYRDAVSPLRVESGPVVTCVWPSPWEDPVAGRKESDHGQG
jgi:hypothetical protein